MQMIWYCCRGTGQKERLERHENLFEPVKDFISRPWGIWEIKLRSAKNKIVECRQQENIVTQLLVWSQTPELHMDLADLIIYPLTQVTFGPRQANLVLIAYASSEGSGEPAHPRSLARTFAARSYKQWVKRNFQKESQIPGPSEWLGMRS